MHGIGRALHGSSHGRRRIDVRWFRLEFAMDLVHAPLRESRIVAADNFTRPLDRARALRLQSTDVQLVLTQQETRCGGAVFPRLAQPRGRLRAGLGDLPQARGAGCALRPRWRARDRYDELGLYAAAEWK